MIEGLETHKSEGNIQSTLGNVQSTLGNIQSTLGNIQSTLGNIQSTLGNIRYARLACVPPSWCDTAAMHLNMIVWRYRKLCKTSRYHIDNICTTGVG
jgi:hypothetical protein